MTNSNSRVISPVEPREETVVEKLGGKTALATGSTDGVGRRAADPGALAEAFRGSGVPARKTPYSCLASGFELTR
jgi:hypothetical protein